jgi:hypothetical protein
MKRTATKLRTTVTVDLDLEIFLLGTQALDMTTSTLYYMAPLIEIFRLVSSTCIRPTSLAGTMDPRVSGMAMRIPRRMTPPIRLCLWIPRMNTTNTNRRKIQLSAWRMLMPMPNLGIV